MSRPIEAFENRLAPDEVQVWLVRAERVEAAERYAELLCDDERARWRRYRVESARRQFLLARALVRTTLSQYFDVPPAEWRFVSNDYGRPEIATPVVTPRLRFNLSHTHGLLACAVAWERDLGIDVEYLRRRSGGMNLAERYFSPLETADLHARPEAEQRDGFFDYWTLKEAYIKARSKGLAIPLADFSYHLRAGQPPRISFAPRLNDDPRIWQFWQASPTPDHRLALAIARGVEQSDLRISVQEVSL